MAKRGRISSGLRPLQWRIRRCKRHLSPNAIDSQPSRCLNNLGLFIRRPPLTVICYEITTAFDWPPIKSIGSEIFIGRGHWAHVLKAAGCHGPVHGICRWPRQIYVVDVSSRGEERAEKKKKMRRINWRRPDPSGSISGIPSDGARVCDQNHDQRMPMRHRTAENLHKNR